MNIQLVRRDKVSTVVYCLWYVVLILAYIGGNITLGKLGEFHVLPYRILLFFFWLIFLIVLIHNRGRIRLPVHHGEAKLYLLFLLLWFVYALLSFFWVSSRTDWIRHCFFLFSGFSIIFFSLYNFDSKQRLKQLYIFWIICIGCMLAVGVWENLTSQHLPNSNVTPQYGYIHPLLLRIPAGVYRNPNDYATFLCLTAPLSLSLFRYTRNAVLKAVGGLLVVLAIYLIIYTSSRLNMIAFLLEGITVIILAIKKKNYKFLIRLFLFIIVGIVILFFISRVSNIFVGQYLRKIPSGFRNLITGDASIYARKNLIRNGYLFLKDTAFFGVGAGNNEWYQEYRGVYETLGKTSMHNWWMELLVDYGIFIFFLYVAFYISLIRNLYRATRSDFRIISISAESLFISLIGFSIASISSSSIFGDRTIWFLFATAITVVNIDKLERVNS